MRTEVFNSASLGVSIFREEDGSLTWNGTYNGIQMKEVMPVDGDCIILLDPDASKQPVFKNLLRIGRDGDLRWLADLPRSPDAFVDMRLENNYLAARTWSGYAVRIDPNSGRCLAQDFVK